MKKLLFFALLLSFSSYAQEEHAWIYFKDKPNVQQALENPSTILSAKAIARKSLRGTPIDVRDIPVNEEYISIIKDYDGISVKAKSKWMNCIHVIGSIQNINSLSVLDFVSEIEFANKTLSSRSQSQVARQSNKLESNFDFNYGPAENQTNMLNTDFLHENDFTGEGITIAVMDAGFPNVNSMATFERLRSQNKLLGGYDFPSRSNDFSNSNLNNHGTLVLATMAGFKEESFTGTAPDASYYLFRTEVGATETPVEETYWVEAAERADSLGVDIINTSLGYTLFDNANYSYTPGDMDGNTTFISRGANIATEKGMLVVTSAGNRGDENYFKIIGAPADANVLSVGAVTPNREYAFFSSTGPSADGRIKPDVAAQGHQIVTVDQFDNLIQANGTSFSSPILAGSIASLWQLNPEWTNLELMQIVRESASTYSNPNSELGYGIPDFQQILIEFDYTLDNEESEDILEFTLFPNPVQNTLRFSKPSGQNFDLTLFDSLGHVLLQKNNVQNEIDLTGFSRGIYIVMFEQNNSRNSFLILKE